MSQRREQLTERLPGLDSALSAVESWYHVPLLLVLAGFMLWIRVRNWENFLINGRVYFSANDPWYHLRQVRYTVQNWPWTMPFDPWTGFPTGTSVGQFGTLYDQLVATVALIVGLGNPTDQTTALVLLFAPAVLGTLVVVPTYFIGKHFGGRFGGVIGVAVLALSPSSFLARSVVGFSDHHVAEALFQALAVAVIVVALSVAEREKPVYEQFRERDFESLRRPVGWAALAGFTTALYVWTWPPGLLLVGIFGVFLLVALPIEYLRGESPEHVAIVGAVALSVTGLLLALTFKTAEISVTTFSTLHPALAVTGALGCVFMAWLARAVETRDLPALAYPGTILGLFVLGVGVMALALPTLFGFFLDQLDRVVGFGTNAAALTVGEVQPPENPFSFLFASYSFALLTAAAGAAILLLRLALGRTRKRAAALFILVWAAFMLSATLTQARFNYYLLVPVAVLTAYFVGQVLRFVGSSDAQNLRNLDTSQVLAVVTVVFLVTVPLATGSAGTLTAAGASANAQASGPGPSVLGWDGSLEWLQNNAPTEGTYGGGNDSMEYYGEFDRTTDFDYPDGAYGVLSWWDYGHWITVLGHRTPVANPFQQNVRIAANYLLATDPQVANRIARMSDGEGVRYVMVDWKMADPAGGGLFSAPFVWENNRSVALSDAVSPIYARQSNGNLGTVFLAYDQRYYETMRTRLYAFHGSEIEREPVVLDYESPTGRTNDSLGAAFYPRENNTSVVKRFENMSAARTFVEQDGSAQIGGVGRYPHERVPALEHYRLVHASQENAIGGPSGVGPLYQSALQRLRVTGLNATELFPTTTNWVKTFERVPGARVVGQAPPNSTVEATVEMGMPNSNATFNYTQQATTNAQGRFTMTLPYSTTGYENWGTQRGATDVSVRASGPYTVHTVEDGSENATWTATTHVSEGAVIGRTNETIRVELSRESVSSRTDTTGVRTPTNATTTENASADSSGNDSAGANASSANTTNASAMMAPGPGTTGSASLTPAQARVAR